MSVKTKTYGGPIENLYRSVQRDVERARAPRSTGQAGRKAGRVETSGGNSGVWAIDDGHSNQITTGLQAHEARKVAQGIADRRGETVYLYEEGSKDYESVRPIRTRSRVSTK